MPGSTGETEAAAAQEYRSLLFSIAYGMTGSVGDAEDIVQDAFLGLTRACQAGTVIADQKAYLTTAVTRLGINYLSSARVRRETYVGDWLPEPIVFPADGQGPAEHAELADSLSIAFLVLLEALSPTERAVFMLREAFGYGYPDVARVTGKTEVNCRQIFARARQRIAAGGQSHASAPSAARRAEGEELARRFFDAADGGDMDALLAMLAPDVVLHGDGGGKAQAIGTAMHGREGVARLLTGLFRRGRTLGTSLRLAWVNGQPGAVGYDAEGRVFTVLELEVSAGVVQAIHAVVNPDKLGHLGPVSDVARLPKEELPMTDFQAIADRVEIEALRGEFSDAVMMRDRARLAALFTADGALRMPNIPAELVGPEEIRAGGEKLQARWEFFVQTTHPGTIQLDGDTATGRAYIQELARTNDGYQGLNYAIYHDRYQRTADGWKFAERVYEVRYEDTSPLAGSAPESC
jgi:RNA polymerase sigma factor (sigma-70 family)